MNAKALIAGGGGFIGGHLAAALLAEGYEVRSVDVKPLDQWYQVHGDVENQVADLRLLEACETSMQGVTRVYNLACDMGGMGFIEGNKAACMRNVLIGAHLLDVAATSNLERFFFASSACVYPAHLQRDTGAQQLRESDAYPADPEDGYGWEKLFTERMCKNYGDDFDIPVRVGRYHNVYGPQGTWRGGREKAPAAICRKIATAALTGHHEIEVWGDGEQTRSFMYIDDCIEGTRRLVDSDIDTPLNIGSSEMISINGLIELVSSIAGIEVAQVHDLSAPQGVRGRNSDNTLVRASIGWEPSVSLREGMTATYAWIHQQVEASLTE